MPDSEYESPFVAEEADEAPEEVAVLPEGAVSAADPDNPTKEEIVASALRPGPNVVAEDQVVEAEDTGPATVTVAPDVPEGFDVEDLSIQVPGLDPSADYVEDVDGIAVIKLSGEVELPAAIGELVAETAFAKVVE
jgi:hypothetical protein